MKKNTYSEEETRYSEIIDTLKSLPEIKAPDNFEYNLMIKIQNGQFESNLKKNKSTNKLWIFIPSTAVALSTILLFTIFIDFSSKETKEISLADLQYITPRIQTYESSKEFSPEKSKSVRESEKLVKNKEVLPNDVIETETEKYPFNQNYSVDVDNYIEERRHSQQSGSNHSMLASGGVHYPEFNGFYLRQQEMELIRLYKARLDSIIEASENGR
ncbi:MAG: hypothetical protein GXX85_12890 [Ignavibacteria bacterium]|nr:hypothetical protein [Ignavibacteria bacterium]